MSVLHIAPLKGNRVNKMTLNTQNNPKNSYIAECQIQREKNHEEQNKVKLKSFGHKYACDTNATLKHQA